MIAPKRAEAVQLFLTFQVPGKFYGTKFDYGDIVKYDTVTHASSLFFDAEDNFQPGHLGGGIDALEVLSDGTLLLSTKDTAKFPGYPFFQRDDIVHYDPVHHTAQVILDGAAHFSNHVENIDIIDLLPDGSFLLSTSNDATFDGHTFGPDDIFRYDPTHGTVSLFWHADSIFKTPVNLDAFDILPDGRYLFSTFQETETLLNGMKINDADLVVYDPTTGKSSIFLDHHDIPDWRGKHRDLKDIDIVEESPPPPPVVPEPMSMTMTLMGLGFFGAALQRRRSVKTLALIRAVG